MVHSIDAQHVHSIDALRDDVRMMRVLVCLLKSPELHFDGHGSGV